MTDNHFDDGSHPDIAIQENIKNMILANNSCMQNPSSQVIIDSDLQREKVKNVVRGDFDIVPDEAMHKQRQGTLYTRLAPRPSMFSDKGARDQLFVGAKWQSIGNDVGCWICNASKGGRK